MEVQGRPNRNQLTASHQLVQGHLVREGPRYVRIDLPSRGNPLELLEEGNNLMRGIDGYLYAVVRVRGHGN